jgi:peptidoglycan/LPS O-acetylase OafA/YrhL
MSSPRQARSLPALDGFRGIAAISVVAFHLINTTAPVWFDAGPPQVVRDALHHLGVNGVSAFFVLSGFLVSKPFVENLVDGRALSVPRYVRARFLRIMPLWWIVLFTVILVSNRELLTQPWHLFLLLTLEQNWDTDVLRQVVPPAWSLVIEVSFYAMVPLGWLGLRTALRGRVRRVRIAATGASLLALLVAGLIVHAWWLAPERLPHPDLRPFSFSLPVWIDQFALGVLAAWAFVSFARHLDARALRYAAVVPILAAWRVFGDPQIWAGTFFALGCALLVLGLAADGTSLTARTLSAPALRRLGWWSYGIYLWHLPIQYALVRTGLIDHGRPGQTWVALPVMLALAIGAGYLSFRLVESAALGRIDRPDWWMLWRWRTPATSVPHPG